MKLGRELAPGSRGPLESRSLVWLEVARMDGMSVRSGSCCDQRGLVRAPDRGATAVEYAIMVSLIAAVIATIVATLGTQVSTLFQSVVGKF
jgi:Flp/Fap pilin component.